MVTWCCAFGCNEKSVAGGPITFHRFPKDEERRKQWSTNIGRENFKITDYTRICSKHFTPDSFDREKFGGTWLKKDAVPTLFDYSSDLIKEEAKRCRSPEVHLQKASPVIQRNDLDANLSDNSAKKENAVCYHSNDGLKQQQEEAASSNPTDDSSAGPSNVKPPYVMKESKMFVNVAFFVKSLQNLNNHGGDGCNFSDMYISGETINSWNVGLELSCTKCLTTVVVWMQDPGPDSMKQHSPMPPISDGETAKKIKKTAVTAEQTTSSAGSSKHGRGGRPPKKSVGRGRPPKKSVDPVPEKKRRVSTRKTSAPPPYPPIQHFILPPPLARPLHVPQSNSPLHVPQSNSIHQNLMDNPSNSTNSHLINQVPFIKQEDANAFLNRVPLSSTQPACIQLLFSVENSNDMPLSLEENAASTPGATFKNHQTSSEISLKNSQIMATSANETIVPEATPTEILPVDLNLIKAENEEEYQCMEVNNLPSVRIVPMSETSINRLETAFASESFTETSKDSTLVTTKSVMANTKNYATGSGAKLSASVSDILGAEDSSISSPISAITQTVFHHVIPSSKDSTLVTTKSVMANTKNYATGSGAKLSASVSDILGAEDSSISSPISAITQTVFHHVIPSSKEDFLRQTSDSPSNNIT